MSVPLEASEIGYTGNGVTVAFPIPFPWADDEDIDVMLLLDGETVAVAQVDGVDYTLTGASNPNDGEGGVCTMAVAPPANSTLTISRTVPITQGTNLRTSGPFTPATHMAMFDKLTFICQQLARRIAALEALADLVDISDLEGIVVSTEFETDPDAVENTFPIEVVMPEGFTPTGVMVARCENLDDGGVLFQEAVSAANWAFAAGTLFLLYVPGLSPGVNYKLTLFCVSLEEAS